MSISTTINDNVNVNFTQVELDSIISVSGIAIWEYDMFTKQLKINDNWFSLLGYQRGDIIEQISSFFALIHPDDLPKLENESYTYLINPEQEVLQFQFRMRTKQNQWKWLRNRSRVERDKNGVPIKWAGSVMDISKLKESENQVIKNNLHLNSVVNSLSDIVYEIDGDYNFINCWIPDSNPLATKIKSYKGRNIKDVFKPNVFKLFKSLIDKTITSGKPQSFKYFAQSSKKHYLARTTLITDSETTDNHITMIIQDISSFQITRKKLEEKEANLNAMIQNTSDVFWAIDKNEKLIVFNQAFHNLYTGISSHIPKVGKQLNDDFLLDETAKRWRLIHSRSITGKDTVFSKHVIFRNGDVRLFEFHINPFRDKNNEIIGSVVTGRDIDDIYTAKKIAEKAARLKSKFVSTISHEIRTPLNAILGTCHQLDKINKQEDLKEDLNILHLASENLLSLVNDVLDFTKLDSGKSYLKPLTFNFKDFLDAFNQFTNNLVSKKNLKLVVDYDKNLPTYLLADKPKLHQILTNILSNAVKYTDSGTITFSVKKLGTVNDISNILFTVTDTGIGIPKKEINGIFDSFSQSSASYQMLKGGTGLGLSITKNLVALLGGDIKVESKLGQGSIFNLTLPLNTATKKVEEHIKNIVGDLSGYHILVAEDNEINAKIITRLLSQWNGTYDLAVNGQIATELAQKTVYDLILMDIQMPLKNGFEASSEIRLFPNSLNRETAIIALTAQPDFSFDPSFREGLFDGYILKPFHPDNLKRNIIEYLSS